MPERRVQGRSAVTRRAITDIVRTAALGSYGIAGFASPRPIDRLVRWLRLGEPAIRIRYDDGLRIVLHVRVAYGLPVAEVARQVESAVRFAVGRALGRGVDVLTIHVDGLDDRASGAPPSSAAQPAGEGPAAGPDAAIDGPASATAPGAAPERARDAAPERAPDPTPNGRPRNGRPAVRRLPDGGTPAAQTPVAPTGGET